MSSTGSNHDSHGRSGSGRKTSSSSTGRGLCTFWLGARHFGLDVSLVGEVVTLDTIASVPASPPAVRGLFNLRGTPVALLDLSVVLDLEAAKSEGSTTALVLRNDELLLGLVIDRMEAVTASDRGTFVERGAEDHPAVSGFLELAALDGEKKEVVTVLEPAVLLERLEATRLSRVED
jgi:purine-binding chemotaxis protein CheW